MRLHELQLVDDDYRPAPEDDEPHHTKEHTIVFDKMNKLFKLPIVVDGKRVLFKAWLDEFERLPYNIQHELYSGQILRDFSAHLAKNTESGKTFKPSQATKIPPAVIDGIRNILRNEPVKAAIRDIMDYSESVAQRNDWVANNYFEYILTSVDGKEEHDFGDNYNSITGINNVITGQHSGPGGNTATGLKGV